MILLVQGLIVFGVPLGLGWLFARRILREDRVFAATPIASVSGLAFLILLVNCLRFFLSMGVALAMSYIVILLSAAAIYLFSAPCEKRAVLFSGESFSRIKGVALFATALVLAVYFGVPSFMGILQDAWWCHYPLAVQILRADDFPLVMSFQPDTPLFYHVGPDLLASIWCHLMGLSVQDSFALNVVIFVPCIFLASFSLLYKLSGRFIPSFAGAVCALLAGNAKWLLLLGGRSEVGSAISVINSQTVEGMLEMVFCPTHLLAVPITLVLMNIFLGRDSLGLLQRAGFIIVLLLAALAVVAEWYFVVYAFSLGAVAAAGGVFRSVRQAAGSFGFVMMMLGCAFILSILLQTHLTCNFANYWVKGRQRPAEISSRVINYNMSTGSKGDTVQYKCDADIKYLEGSPVGLITKPGFVPSWHHAYSNSSSWRSILDPDFLLELMPAVLLGVPCAFAFWRKHVNYTVSVMLAAGLLSGVVPLIFEWRYRAVDILRFFTIMFSIFAVFAGYAAGNLMLCRSWKQRLAGLCMLVLLVANSVIMGWSGITGRAAETAQKVYSEGVSLSDVEGAAAGVSTGVSQSDYDDLCFAAAEFLNRVAGRGDRVAVLVSPELVPPQDAFPMWMRAATTIGYEIPCGSYWAETEYSYFYHRAVDRLDIDAMVVLGLRWIIVPSVYFDGVSAEAKLALNDETRVQRVERLLRRTDWVDVYRVVGQ